MDHSLGPLGSAPAPQPVLAADDLLPALTPVAADLPSPEPVESQASVGDREYRLEFAGNTSEYFRIWIINVALTIASLGVYSAWAKVRSQRYLLRNTRLAGESFDYHADPMAILRGRLVMAVVVVGYVLAVKFAPDFEQPLLLGIALLWPWIHLQALRFAMRNTSYRNVRFDFAADTFDAYANALTAGAITAFSLGFAYPSGLHAIKKFRIDRTRLGDRPFRFTAESGPFYGVVYRGAGLGVLFWLVALACGVGAHLGLGVARTTAQGVAAVCIYFGMFAVGTYTQAGFARVTAQGTEFGEVRFGNALAAPRLLGLQVTNILAIIGTLGLAIPWATIRMRTYRAQCVTVYAPASAFDELVTVPVAAGGAVADAAVDLGDIDLGL